ncbi:MAG TPA: glycosyltransferase, partial [Candidatus Nitrosotenuis sp.]|nr:glycosyltransferase [Candidatus Nitrosotenuis sp.]
MKPGEIQSANAQVSIIIPTYNESQNILKILKSIQDYLPKNTKTQTIVVDDNSPDGTGRLVEEYMENVRKITNNTIQVIHRKTKDGLSSAILKGIQFATGNTIVVMDSDLSHPASLLPK